MALSWVKTYKYWVCRIDGDLELRIEPDVDGYWFVDSASYMSPYMDITKPFHQPHDAARYVERQLRKVLHDLHRFYLEGTDHNKPMPNSRRNNRLHKRKKTGQAKNRSSNSKKKRKRKNRRK